MKIKEVSETSGLSISRLRYYEELGIITPHRDHNGYRDYSPADLRWIDAVIRIKRTGMPLADIQKYAELRRGGAETIPERMVMLNTQRQALVADIARIQKDVDYVDWKLDAYRQQL